MSSKKG
jgi:hypothetical protein